MVSEEFGTGTSEIKEDDFMHITLEADYAVRMVELLAAMQTRLDAGKIAEETNVPQRFCLKILRNLVAAGIVKSYKGSRGGYELAASPEQITLRQVIEAVEGPYQISRCVGKEHDCAGSCSREFVCDCRFQKVYRDISQMVREKLDSVTFAQPSILNRKEK